MITIAAEGGEPKVDPSMFVLIHPTYGGNPYNFYFCETPHRFAMDFKKIGQCEVSDHLMESYPWHLA